MSKTVLLTATVANKIMASAAVQKEFPTLLKFASETPPKTKSGCGSCANKAASVSVQKTIQYIKGLPQDRRDVLKRLAGIAEDQQLITFQRSPNKQLQRIEL